MRREGDYHGAAGRRGEDGWCAPERARVHSWLGHWAAVTETAFPLVLTSVWIRTDLPASSERNRKARKGGRDGSERKSTQWSGIWFPAPHGSSLQ